MDVGTVFIASAFIASDEQDTLTVGLRCSAGAMNAVPTSLITVCSCISARKQETGSGSKPHMLRCTDARHASQDSSLHIPEVSRRRAAPAMKLPLPQAGSSTRRAERSRSDVYLQASRMRSTSAGGVEK